MSRTGRRIPNIPPESVVVQLYVMAELLVWLGPNWDVHGGPHRLSMSIGKVNQMWLPISKVIGAKAKIKLEGSPPCAGQDDNFYTCEKRLVVHYSLIVSNPSDGWLVRLVQASTDLLARCYSELSRVA
ncbi:hypothetical protein BHE74_00030634 [Ensete ventricosum]|nr:hypothetical protein BHE74_00030634 [Ensete ventricosum]